VDLVVMNMQCFSLILFFVCLGTANIFASHSRDSLLAASQVKISSKINYQSVSCVDPQSEATETRYTIPNKKTNATTAEKIPLFDGKRLIYVDKAEYDAEHTFSEECPKVLQEKCGELSSGVFCCCVVMCCCCP
jgi:hypothetical protein